MIVVRRLAALIVVAALAAGAYLVPPLRRALIRAVVSYDAIPGDAAPLPGGRGGGLTRTPRTRVVLIDGLSAEVAATLPRWRELCARGLDLVVDVGFPTVSLPVEVALWSGLTQQQTGIVFRSDRPLIPPLRGIPAQVPGAIAIAEHHGWIARSLGFAVTEPAAEPGKPVKDAGAAAWATTWEARASWAVASPAPLVFVHVLRVDSVGHKQGVGPAYLRAAAEADAILGRLVAADPGARWFALSDHGHVPAGGHGGEERALRQVASCIAGPGVVPGRGGPLHVVDISRALADSTGARLPVAARGRPLTAALAAPLADDQAVPAIALGHGAGAIFVLVAGLALSAWSVRRWWLAPWWFVAACAALVVLRGEPTLSSRMIYAPEGRDMYLAWLPVLALATVATFVGLARSSLARVVVAQLALPVAAVAAALTAAGAWPTLLGAEVAPVVPRYTAYCSPLLLIAAHGALAVALGVLARLVRPPSAPRAPTAPPRSARAAAG